MATEEEQSSELGGGSPVSLSTCLCPGCELPTKKVVEPLWKLHPQMASLLALCFYGTPDFCVSSNRTSVTVREALWNIVVNAPKGTLANPGRGKGDHWLTVPTTTAALIYPVVQALLPVNLSLL